jgi:very-short-patch-repair endonuclease
LNGFKFRRQVPIDRYIADFVCLEAKLVVELDGGQHVEQMAYDAARTEVLEAHGFHVIRFWNYDVMRELDGVITAIQHALESGRRPFSSPLP